MKTRDVLGLGCATIDELLFVSHYPGPDQKQLVTSREIQGGGLTMTALVAGARWGAKCAYGGMLGPDETSRKVADLMAKEGIDLSLTAWRDDAAAIRSTIIVDTSANTRNIFFERPGLVGAPPDSPSEGEIAASRVLLVDHYGGEGNLRAIGLARRNGVPVVADFERDNVPFFAAFFPLVSHPILSLGFARKLTGQTEPENVVRALWNEFREVVIVTLGEDGCVAFDGETTQFFPAFATEVVDTTGCGDVFHGVYAATLAQGFSLEKRVRFSSMAASLKARKRGAQAGIPSRVEVETATN